MLCVLVSARHFVLRDKGGEHPAIESASDKLPAVAFCTPLQILKLGAQVPSWNALFCQYPLVLSLNEILFIQVQCEELSSGTAIRIGHRRLYPAKKGETDVPQKFASTTPAVSTSHTVPPMSLTSYPSFVVSHDLLVEAGPHRSLIND